MVKREHDGLNDSQSHRAKRHKDQASSSDVEMEAPAMNTVTENAEDVKSKGLQLLQAVKEATSKDGRPLGQAFLKKPPKKTYPDYYQLIAHPIAFDDIKKQIENGAYPTFRAVRDAFDLCFNNAKQYNLKESVIWRDAKDLMKVVSKTYHKLQPSGESGSGEHGEKKPNMSKLMKSRLQKLVDKADDSGHVLSAEFMDYPDRKLYPYYYQVIHNPQCFDNIFKRIKHKEYPTMLEFANDVELIFSNAFQFNQEKTPIYEDALSLRSYFNILMSDLPPPYTLSQYSQPTNTKIKIKVAHTPSVPAPQPAAPVASTSHVTLRVPAPQNNLKSVAVPPIRPKSPTLPSTNAISVVSVAAKTGTATRAQTTAASVPKPQAQLPQPQALPAIAYQNNPYQYSHAAYMATSVTPVSTPVVPVATPQFATSTPSNSQSPAPRNLGPELQSMLLRTEPRGRPICLDHKEGVKSWCLHLGPQESALSIEDVIFFNEEEEESSDDDEEEEAGNNNGDMEAIGKNEKTKPKRGRGRPPKKTSKLKAPRSVTKKKSVGHGLQVKLNGTLQEEKEDHPGSWLVSVPVGYNTIEIGEKAGSGWKIYAQRY